MIMETYRLVSFILSGVIFSAFWLYVYFRHGVQKSISDSYYKLRKGHLFTLALWGFSLPLIVAVETPLIFFAAAFIGFTGTAADFRQKMTDVIHVIGAVGGVVLGLASLIFDFKAYLYVIAIIVAIYALDRLKIKNKTWWVETVAFIGIYLTLLIKMI